VVNVSQLERFEEGAEIGAVELSAAGWLAARKQGKILGDGDLTKRLSITATSSARRLSRNTGFGW